MPQVIRDLALSPGGDGRAFEIWSSPPGRTKELIRNLALSLGERAKM
jgi:hypothetical protein